MYKYYYLSIGYLSFTVNISIYTKESWTELILTINHQYKQNVRSQTCSCATCDRWAAHLWNSDRELKDKESVLKTRS